MLIRINEYRLRKQYTARRVAKSDPVYRTEGYDRRQVLFDLDDTVAQRLIAEGKAALPQRRNAATHVRAAKQPAAKQPQRVTWFGKLIGRIIR